MEILGYLLLWMIYAFLGVAAFAIMNYENGN